MTLAPSPRLRRPVAAALASAALVAVVTGVLVSVGGVGGSGTVPLSGSGLAAVGSDQATAAPAAPAGRISISGGVAGLYPGASLPLVLTVVNPEPFKLVVTSVTTTVASSSAQCPGTLLGATPFSGKQAVPAHGSAHVTVTATLAHSAPNACQGAHFPFHYSGLAKKE
jgi:hypothetical protein